ncbi:hypothetical protein [Mucilaginibacter myungsuensis]|uniref:DoxX-like protein n=1 Tax=Mucilaginibacter myungsuensis TaxID=649104 RepID=A0A929PXQ3_9SPHI|nr:hypothetical protein [Mucilaginibacter myungsuensis]MBE9662645.1 hypothetical protein [Mucilaginibacter myungsuensis]MDN3598065.1 hypothetical protein [Mucilaginibacter myungsuensis]
MENFISRLKQNLLLQVFTINLRYLLGSAFVYASIFKINGIRFMPKPTEGTPINTLSHFFEAMYQAGVYWHFIGWGQLIAGFLIMSQSFSTLGAVAFFPLILNIFVITISFNAPNILLVTTLMLFANTYLLIWDWNRLKFICLPGPLTYIDDKAAFSKKKIWTFIGLVLFFVVVSFRLYQTYHYML